MDRVRLGYSTVRFFSLPLVRFGPFPSKFIGLARRFHARNQICKNAPEMEEKFRFFAAEEVLDLSTGI